MYRVVIIVCCWMLLFTEAAPNQNTQANLESPDAVEGETIIEQSESSIVRVSTLNWLTNVRLILVSPTGTILFNALNNSIVCVNATCIFTEKGNLSTVLNLKKSYHLFSDFKADFLGALHWCLRFGMKLASIKSSEENEIFTAAFLKHNRRSKKAFWLNELADSIKFCIVHTQVMITTLLPAEGLPTQQNIIGFRAEKTWLISIGTQISQRMVL